MKAIFVLKCWWRTS
ncbi:trp operon leader peptide [Escherichia coli]|nr:trp operon leader peptide [Escherichia coli]MCV5998926.1 trp operon leader peptide [Escherichia coli]HCJ8609501.1 trp operon leader peptide [Escherichia coli]HCJ9012466.1 trp operon leader peptide [Escherichia coli]HCJ9229172.1 trp operon leader peptide [Escherichia coli]HCJ9515465.1 trp operon leader peptide [Escherichia coli]